MLVIFRNHFSFAGAIPFRFRHSYREGTESAEGRSIIMTARFLVLFLVIGLASTCVVKAQVAAPAHLPAQSPSPAKKNRHLKGVEATASPAETLTSPVTTESPGVSPEATRPRRKTEPKATASPAPSPTPSRGFRLKFPKLFKPKSSVSASPSGH